MTTNECECEDIDYAIATAAATLGRKGGRAKTEKKARAARENGKKGGRPRKDRPDSVEDSTGSNALALVELGS